MTLGRKPRSVRVSANGANTFARARMRPKPDAGFCQSGVFRMTKVKIRSVSLRENSLESMGFVITFQLFCVLRADPCSPPFRTV